MSTRTQHPSSPLILPMLASIVATSIIASLVVVVPYQASLSLQQLLARAAFDLTLAACIHVATVWSLWRLVRDYVEPSFSVLALHIWAVVLWLPLIITLSAERSLWISCILPWAFANGITFLNLWSKLPEDEESTPKTVRVFLQPPSPPPLVKTLLPYCITIVLMQTGLACLAVRHAWSASALISGGVLLFLMRHPFVRSAAKSRGRFSTASLLQTAAAFVLISTALTPYLQKAYGLRALASFMGASAVHPSRLTPSVVPRSEFTGVILTLPAKPHPRILPSAASHQNSFGVLVKPVVIPFDGAYWFFKAPATHPEVDARVQRGDPIRANVRSTDRRPLLMEAHQALPAPVPMDCCSALQIDLVNGDDRPGVIRVGLMLKDASARGASLVLGSLPVRSSELEHVPMGRLPVRESLRFRMPARARSYKQFDEITVVIQASSERALGGSKIAIENFVLIP